jgi:hypothetical protein
MCNNCCFSTVTMVAGTRLNITLYVHYLSCWNIYYENTVEFPLRCHLHFKNFTLFSPYFYQPDDRALPGNHHGSKRVSLVKGTAVPSLSVLQVRAMAQAVGRRPLTADARVRFLHPRLHLTTANTRRKKYTFTSCWESSKIWSQFRNPSLFVKWVSVFYYANHFIVYTSLYLTIFDMKSYAVCVYTVAVQATF